MNSFEGCHSMLVTPQVACFSYRQDQQHLLQCHLHKIPISWKQHILGQVGHTCINLRNKSCDQFYAYHIGRASSTCTHCLLFQTSKKIGSMLIIFRSYQLKPTILWPTIITPFSASLAEN